MLIHFTLSITCIFVYLYGFFPISEDIFVNEHNVETQAFEGDLRPQNEKVVLIIIDALRSDFVTADLMPLTTKLAQKTGCFMDVKVESPTVTLPRIKTIVMGNIPKYLEVFMNLGNKHVITDSWLHKIKARNKSIVFYGDNTWLDLFPDFFLRSEGTSSFFVKDFYEVDSNVTRNVHLELGKNDWDIMILHYLGLDHIGHVLGPFSPKIRPKLTEMDAIIHQIYTTILEINKTQPPVVIITGDHGMKDSGGHGGSTYAETHVPLVILGKQCTNDTIDQVDIATNMAAILGVSTPFSSIGKIRQSLLSDLNIDKYLKVLKTNTELLKNKSNICDSDFKTGLNKYEEYVRTKNLAKAHESVEIFEKCQQLISDTLITASVTQNLTLLILSILILTLLILKIVINIQKSSFLNIFDITIVLTSLSINLTFPHDLIFCFTSLLLGLLILKQLKAVMWRKMTFTLLIPFLNYFSWVSSSFIEEEHLFWYFFATSMVICYLIISAKRFGFQTCKNWAILAIFLRFLRIVNQTGDQWAHLSDFSDFLLQDVNKLYYKAFAVIGLCANFYVLALLVKNYALKCVVVVILVLVYFFKFVIVENVILAQCVYFLIFFVGVFSCNGVAFWILVSNLLLNPYNLFLGPVLVYANYLTPKNNVVNFVVFNLAMSKALFFMQGHSNSIASLDINPGYIGLINYKPFFVFIQVLAHAYFVPILSHLLFLNHVNVEKRSNLWKSLFLHQLFCLATLFVLLLNFRFHIYVWTVFAPKLIIETMHCVVLYLEILFYYFCTFFTHEKLKIIKN